MNEFLFFLTIFINFILVLLVYKFLGRVGLYVWIAFATVFANIVVLKNINLFGFSVTLGNVLFATVSLTTDILNENYGKNDAKRAVKIGFVIMFISTIITQLTLAFVPNSNDFASESLNTIFSLSPRLFLASMIAFMISNNINVVLFDLIRKKIPDTKFFWIRNNVSTLIAQIIDTTIFTFVAFYNIYDNKYCFILIGTTFILKSIIAIIDTLFLYIAKQMKKRNCIKEI